jgi:hypothetical protein
VVIDGLALEVVDRSTLDEKGRAAIVELCSSALNVDCRDLFGFLPADSTHLRAILEGRLVGHACWSARSLAIPRHEPLRAAWVDTVVVVPELQSRGFGSSIMRSLDGLTATFDLRALGTEQMPFFARLGWERWEGPTLGVLHDPLDTLMVLRTVTTPALDLGSSISAAD